MNKLLITADVHGSLSGWLTITAMLGKADHLAVAGDLFDTRYGNYGHPDFQPEEIKSALKTTHNPVHYVYGNCDIPEFMPGFKYAKTFSIFGKEIYLHHGHQKMDPAFSGDIVIQGHTHLCKLERHDGKILLNPGSIVRPKNQAATYAVIDQSGVSLVELKTSKIIAQSPFTAK